MLKLSGVIFSLNVMITAFECNSFTLVNRLVEFCCRPRASFSKPLVPLATLFLQIPGLRP